jgi:hypothetical protein
MDDALAFMVGALFLWKKIVFEGIIYFREFYIEDSNLIYEKV